MTIRLKNKTISKNLLQINLLQYLNIKDIFKFSLINSKTNNEIEKRDSKLNDDETMFHFIKIAIAQSGLKLK